MIPHAVLQIFYDARMFGSMGRVLLQHGETHSSKHHGRPPVHGKRPGERFPAGTLGADGVGACCPVAEWVTPARFSVYISFWCVDVLN